MNLKLYLVLFIIAVSTIMLLNSGAVAHVKPSAELYTNGMETITV